MLPSEINFLFKEVKKFIDILLKKEELEFKDRNHLFDGKTYSFILSFKEEVDIKIDFTIDSKKNISVETVGLETNESHNLVSSILKDFYNKDLTQQ